MCCLNFTALTFRTNIRSVRSNVKQSKDGTVNYANLTKDSVLAQMLLHVQLLESC